MSPLVYLMNVSLDGFVETPDGGVDWGVPDPELFGWFTEQVRTASALLYGRRLYETMAGAWPDAGRTADATPAMREFADAWTTPSKIVFSSTLSDVARARLVRGDPIQELVRLRQEFDGELHVGGPTLAATFLRAGLIDVVRQVVHPVVLGGGKRFWPALDRPMPVRLTATRRFPSGVTMLEYVRP